MAKTKKVKEAKQKTKQNVDERVKKIQTLQPPDENPYKMDNENLIDRFWKYKGRNPERLSRRESANKKRR